MCPDDHHKGFVGTKLDDAVLDVATDAPGAFFDKNVETLFIYLLSVCLMFICGLIKEVNSCPLTVTLLFELLDTFLDGLEALRRI